jgi:hypothetical protein
MNRNITSNTLTTTIDFDARVPQLEVPDYLFDADPALALATFAALCTSANVKDPITGRYHVDESALALRQQALFAAGAQVKFDPRDFRDLERTARQVNLEGNPQARTYVFWALRAAYDRAQRLGMAGPGRVETSGNEKVLGFAYIEPPDGRGYGDLASDLAPDLFVDKTSEPDAEAAHWEALRQQFSGYDVQTPNAHTRTRLMTYAAVFAACKPRLCHQEVEAVVLLALYGAGAFIRLTRRQFDLLRMRAEKYIDTMRADRYAKFRNREMAEFALEAALKRAADDGIVVG